MKKTILLIALLLISTVSFSQNVLSLFGKANQFFTLLEEGKFDTAHAYFAESEQTKISVDNLKQLWGSVKTKLGKTESLEAIQSKIQGQYYVVIVNGKFEKDEQDFMLAFDKSEKLVGLFMAPKAVTYTKPSYAADTTLYQEKSVYLQSPGHQLATIITTPKNVKNFPVVVLVHGSGPGDMDETVGPNKPLKDLALGLASKGIATIRYVKRTLIYPNDFGGAFTVKEEVMEDALAAVTLAKTLPGVDLKNIYLLGHSLGGMLAPRLATMAPDLKGIILAAAPARKLTDIILDQNKYMFELTKDTTQATKDKLQEAIGTIEQSRVSQLGSMKPDSLVIGLPASYWVDLNSYDQVAVAKKIKQRILVFQGGNDFQVSEIDYNLWNTALSKKSNATLKLYPELNHLLSPQTEKGTMAQYQVPVNVSEKLIDDIAIWIKGK
ncbi:MAG: alpha/beta fold hydrolase [Pedobacter sp.]|jgi:hypothetical protein|uniref:DUF3887 domain-containing protein n=1 Tax=Pedobacter sp. TaxID=1411316 RepID=UPI003562D113